jgi:hypothetical protein
VGEKSEIISGTYLSLLLFRKLKKEYEEKIKEEQNNGSKL